MTTREHEQTLNVRLSHELKARGLDARPEVMHPGNRRVDVEVRIGPARVAVEAEHGQGSAKRGEAIGDADKRLPGVENLADIAVAVRLSLSQDCCMLASPVRLRRDCPGHRSCWTTRRCGDRITWRLKNRESENLTPKAAGIPPGAALQNPMAWR